MPSARIVSNGVEPTYLGNVLPRLMTPPLVDGPPGGCPCMCALTPETSYGFDVIRFAREVCGTPFDPWQELAVIHLGELLPDGRPRFRTFLILVARQNGKSLLAKVLTLFWMFADDQRLTLVTSSDRTYARKAWVDVMTRAERNPILAKRLHVNGHQRLTTGEESFWIGPSQEAADAELVFAANNSKAARSQTLNRWFCDELREHKNREAWNAATNAMNADRYGQVVCVTNQGDDYAVVLDSLRLPAIEFIETGVGDSRLGIAEWSSPDGAEPDDIEALAQANPNMGRVGEDGVAHGPDADALLSAAGRAKRAGGEELSGFITEVMCRRVALLNPAIEPSLWAKAKADEPLDLAEHRDKVALCLDVSMSGDRADLVAAALINGVVHLDVVKTWSGPFCTKEMRADLPGIVAKVQPRAIGWFPEGPAAVIAADMAKRRRAGVVWPPKRVKLEALTTEATTASMSFAEWVKVGEILHPGDPSLNAQIANAQRLRVGNRWTFGRRGAGPVSGCYAAAGAAWLARTLPPPRPPLGSVKAAPSP